MYLWLPLLLKCCSLRTKQSAQKDLGNWPYEKGLVASISLGHWFDDILDKDDLDDLGTNGQTIVSMEGQSEFLTNICSEIVKSETTNFGFGFDSEQTESFLDSKDFVELYFQWIHRLKMEDWEQASLLKENLKSFKRDPNIKKLMAAFKTLHMDDFLPKLRQPNESILRNAFRALLTREGWSKQCLDMFLEIFPFFKIDRVSFDQVTKAYQQGITISGDQFFHIMEMMGFKVMTQDISNWAVGDCEDWILESLIRRQSRCSYLVLRLALLHLRTEKIIYEIIKRIDKLGTWEVCAAMERNYPTHLILEMLDKATKINRKILLDTAVQTKQSKEVVMVIKNWQEKEISRPSFRTAKSASIA